MCLLIRNSDENWKQISNFKFSSIQWGCDTWQMTKNHHIPWKSIFPPSLRCLKWKWKGNDANFVYWVYSDWIFKYVSIKIKAICHSLLFLNSFCPLNCWSISLSSVSFLSVACRSSVDSGNDDSVGFHGLQRPPVACQRIPEHAIPFDGEQVGRENWASCEIQWALSGGFQTWSCGQLIDSKIGGGADALRVSATVAGTNARSGRGRLRFLGQIQGYCRWTSQWKRETSDERSRRRSE